MTKPKLDLVEIFDMACKIKKARSRKKLKSKTVEMVFDNNDDGWAAIRGMANICRSPVTIRLEPKL